MAETDELAESKLFMEQYLKRSTFVVVLFSFLFLFKETTD